ncbi:MAG: hypothetical protein AAFN74_25200, partial [Myxococcota bacterium]
PKAVLKSMYALPSKSWSANMYHMVGVAHLRLRRVGRAVEALRRGIALQPNDAALQFDLGRALIRRASFAEADDVLNQLPAEWTRSDDRLVAMTRGYAAYRAKRYESAIRHLSTIRTPSSQITNLTAAAWTHWGIQLTKNRRFKSALIAFETASSLQKQIASTANHAAVRYQLGDTKSAYQVWRKLARRYRNPALAFNISTYYDDEVGNEAKAYRWLKKAAQRLTTTMKVDIDRLLLRKKTLFGFSS